LISLIYKLPSTKILYGKEKIKGQEENKEDEDVNSPMAIKFFIF
jgi:hypothetical protein